jgi:thiamine-monophosphate kinase
VGQLQLLGAPLLRAGALAGDVLIVTGTLGDSRAGLQLLQQAQQGRRRADASSRFVLDRHFRPTPRLREIRSVLERAPGAISAALDLSDGLAGDAAHVARASKVSLHIECDRLPLSSELEEVSRREKWDAHEEALRGGEDYELLLCVRRADASQVLDAISSCGTRATIIGQVEEGHARVLVDGVDAPESWTHF